MAIANELPKVIAALNKGLSEAYETTVFTEDPSQDELSAIAIVKNWVPVDTQSTEVRGELWIMRGCRSLMEAQAYGLVLRNQVKDAEHRIRKALRSDVQRSLSPYFSVIQDRNNNFLPGWAIGIKIRSENSKQKAPFLVQILPPFTLSLSIKNVC